MSIAPSSPPISVDSQQQFVVSGSDQYGAPYPLQNVTWIGSYVGTTGTISGGGLLTCGTNGSYTVIATSGTVSVSTSGTVYVPVANSVEILPNPAVMAANAGTQQQFYLWLMDQYGQPIGIETGSWSVPCGGGTIDSDGLFSSNGSTGNFTVSGSSGGMLASGTMNVVSSMNSIGIYPGNILARPANWQGQLSLFALTAAGDFCAPTNAVWSGSGAGTISNSGLVTLDGTTGTFSVLVSSGTLTTTGTIYAYSTTVSSNGDGLSDWQNILMGISPSNMYINGDGLTNAQNIAAGINPFLPYTPPYDPGDTTPPNITIISPQGAVWVP